MNTNSPFTTCNSNYKETEDSKSAFGYNNNNNITADIPSSIFFLKWIESRCRKSSVQKGKSWDISEGYSQSETHFLSKFNKQALEEICKGNSS